MIDLGAGHCRDRVICIKELGEYFPFDPHSKFRIEQQLDNNINGENTLWICNYVLNVIIPEDRDKIIGILNKQLTRGNIILLGVRADRRNIQPYWSKYQDGYITGKEITHNSTFQHFYTIREVRDMFEPHASIKVLHKDGMFILIPNTLTHLLNNLTKFL